MSGMMTNYSTSLMLDCIFGGLTVRSPMYLWVGLSLGYADANGVVDEPADPAYKRVEILNNRINFPPSNGGKKSNAIHVTFPDPAYEWGRIASVFIADKPEGGNVLAMADLTEIKMVMAGDPPPSIPVNGLRISVV